MSNLESLEKDLRIAKLKLEEERHRIQSQDALKRAEKSREEWELLESEAASSSTSTSTSKSRTKKATSSKKSFNPAEVE